MMSIELLNHDKFVLRLQQYQDASRKNMARVINDKLGDVAVTAIGTTYRTNTAKIASEIQRVEGQIVTRKVFKPFGLTKSGKVKKRKIGEYAVGYKAKSVSYAGTYKLVNWLLKNRGLPTLGKTKEGVGGLGMGGGKPGTIGALARRLVAGRKRSINYIRNGWAAAAAVFGKRAKLTRGDYSEEAIKRLGGGTKAESDKARMEGMIFNRAGDLDTRYYPVRKRAISGAVAVGKPGLEEAVEKVMADMAVYLARKNKESSDKLKL
jgi:hypothetical protein